MSRVAYSKTTGKVYTRLTHCPMCGSRRQRCSSVEKDGVLIAYICKYNEAGKPIDTPIGQCYYFNQTDDILSVAQRNFSPSKLEIIESNNDPVFNDRVYKAFQKICSSYNQDGLYEKDIEDIKRRKIPLDLAKEWNIFSIPTTNLKVWDKSGDYQIKVSTAVSKEMVETFGAKLLNVPGFIKSTDKLGNEYITFRTRMKNFGENLAYGKGRYQTIEGYFFPYKNIDGLIEAMQFRLTSPMYNDKGKIIRWAWYSSPQASSGSPIDYYIPRKIKRDDIILITEGALKGRVASEIMGFRSLCPSGVHNQKRLLNDLIKLEKQENKKYKIILCFDMDKNYNEDVLKAEANLVKKLKQTGHEVVISEWDYTADTKGIDDALIAGMKLSYRFA